MFKRIFSAESHTITGAAILLAASSLVSRLMGLIRDRTFAHLFGAGDTLDAYYAAFRIPDFVYNLLIVGALSAGFIPLFTQLKTKDESDAWKFVNNLMQISVVLMSGLGLILFFLAPEVLRLIVPGFEQAKFEFTVKLSRLLLASPIILGLSSIVGGVLQSYKNFFVYSLSPIMYNLGIIFGAIFIVPKFGASGLALGVIFGALLHLGIQLPTLFNHGFKFDFALNFRDKAIKKILGIMGPRTLSLAASDINFIFLTSIASTLASGSVAIFQFSNNLQTFPINMIGVSFAIAAFPTLAEMAAAKKYTDFISHLGRTMRQILFFIIPATIIFLLLRAQIVRVVFGSGAFDWTATRATADTLAFFSLSLFAQCLSPILIRAFFALDDAKTPLYSTLAAAGVSILGSYFFRSYFGIVGLALGFSLGMIAQLSLLMVTLRYRLGTLEELKTLHSLFRLSIAGIFMAITIQTLKTPLSYLVDMTRFWGIFIQGFVAATFGLIVYMLICFLSKEEAFLNIGAGLKRRWLKVKNIPPELREV